MRPSEFRRIMHDYKKIKQQLAEAESKLTDAEFILRTINSEARLLIDYFDKYKTNE